MEALGLGWLAEVAKQGFGYVLFGLSLIVVWWQDKRLQGCQTLSRADAERMTKALTEATETIRQIISVQQERVQIDRELVTVVTALMKQIDTSESRSSERAANIMAAIRERTHRG